MPAATFTPTAADWPKAWVDAPDAFYHRALVHIDLNTNQVDVYNLGGTKTATYTLTDAKTAVAERNGNEVRGLVADATHHARGGTTEPVVLDKDAFGPPNQIIIKPDPSCSCRGYRRTAK